MIATLKKGIRREISQKRNSLSLQDRIERSSRICDKLLNLEEFKKAKVAHFFLTTKSEVITETAISRALSMGKSVVVPVTDRRQRRIFLSELTDYDRELTEMHHGILEPMPEFYRKVSLQDVDIMVLPGIAFDITGHRLGYGAGYYDRFLENEGSRPLLIGLAFEIQIVATLPAGNHDVRMDKIITEDRIIEIKGLK